VLHAGGKITLTGSGMAPARAARASYPWLPSEEITKHVDEILKGYYLSVSYVPIAFRQILRKNGLDELKRLLSSAKVFINYIYKR